MEWVGRGVGRREGREGRGVWEREGRRVSWEEGR